MNKYHSPPKLFIKFLQWFCRPSLLESIEGDLEEQYFEDIKSIGLGKARRRFAWNVLRFFRLGIIKSLGGQTHLNNYGMFKNYLKTSLRSLNKNRLFSSINIVGLAISMSVGILMIVFLSEIYSYDDFHTQKDNIYRVTTHVSDRDREFHTATSSSYIGHQLQSQIPDVEKMVVLRRDLQADLKIEEEAITIKGYYATVSFFDVLSFKLIKGNPQTALANPGAIVLTASTANKLFGDTNPLGKSVTVEGNKDFTIGIITGVMEDPPMHSHLNFEVLVSMETLDNSTVDRRRTFKNNPEDCWVSDVYLVLNETADLKAIESAMVGFMEDYNSRWDDSNFTHFLQPMNDFVIGSDYLGNLPGPSFSQRKIYIMAGLTLIVLLSACFNYTNLSLARALRRYKEVSIRKVIGATRFQVFGQFLAEAILMALMALIVGALIFFLIRPGFLDLPNPMSRGRQMFLLDIGVIELLYFFLFAIVVGCLSGFFPSLVLSKLRAGIVSNGASKIKWFSGVNLRHVLIVFQFTISIGLIMCTVLVHNQYKFAMNLDLGFNSKNIVNLIVDMKYVDILKSEYAKMPEVIETTRSSAVVGTGALGGFAISDDRSDTIRIALSNIEGNYLAMHNFQILAGKEFETTLSLGQDRNQIVVDEQFLKELNLGSPEEAIGKSIWHERDEDAKQTIIGVVQDFVSTPLNAKEKRPFVFFQKRRSKYYRSDEWVLGVKIKEGDVLATLEKLRDVYQEIDPLHPFEGKFHDDELAKSYEQERVNYIITSFLAIIAISISTLGLLGMAVFTTESRMKEISIRKVLGAGVGHLMALLSKGFLVIIITAAAIAIPITYYIVDDKILNEFSQRAEIGLMEILSGFVIVLIIGMVTVGWQVRTAAVQNPADLLRDE